METLENALSISGLTTQWVEDIRDGGPDAHGQTATPLSANPANPCRHCLQLIEPGDDMLVLAHKPFDGEHPYAEIGPIFLHADACQRYQGARFPDWFSFLDPAVVRGYDTRHWIRYDTGAAVHGRDLASQCEQILTDPTIAYVHVRSKFGCYQCRVDRVGAAST